MAWLNYHHLLYFWTIVREGGVSRAARALHITQSTVSGQVRTLERALGHALFRREGRTLRMTETGEVVFRYAEEIFALGRELMETVHGRGGLRPARLLVGVADVLPKLVAFRLLEPALQLPEPVRIVCIEDRPERLLAELAVHRLDVVLTDAPMPPQARVKAWHHLLGECGVTFMARRDLAVRLRRGFPGSLSGAPLLLPLEHTELRRTIDQWLADRGIMPRVVGEFDDSALLKAFGQAGAGVFMTPSVIESEVAKQHRVAVIGRSVDLRARFYAISVERRLSHPAVLAITKTARRETFASSGSSSALR